MCETKLMNSIFMVNIKSKRRRGPWIAFFPFRYNMCHLFILIILKSLGVWQQQKMKSNPKMATYIFVPSYPIGILHANLLNYLHTIMQNIWYETMRYVPHTFKKYLKLSWSIIYINIVYVYLFLFIFHIHPRN